MCEFDENKQKKEQKIIGNPYNQPLTPFQCPLANPIPPPSLPLPSN